MTGRAISFDLSLPPSVNASFANVPGKGRVRTVAYRDWQKQAVAGIIAQARGITFHGTFRIAVLASDQGLTRRRDADNLGKAIAETLTKASTIADDCHTHMRSISLSWCSSLAPGTCCVAIAELSAEPLAGFSRNTRAKAQAKPAAVPASIMAALRARGINVAPERIHVQLARSGFARLAGSTSILWERGTTSRSAAHLQTNSPKPDQAQCLRIAAASIHNEGAH